MLDRFKQTVLSQFEAALWMLRDCIQKCPAECWSGPRSIIGKYEFWHVAYHTLYCTDVYLSPNDAAFQVHPEFHPGGAGDIQDEYPSRMMTKDELLRYLAHCLDKLRSALAAETEASFMGESGFERLTFPRCELYLYSLRHVMHHTGQLSACLRRAGLEQDDQPRWGRAGWQD